MKANGEHRRTLFPAAVHPLVLGVSGVVLCAGCATNTTVGTIRGGGAPSPELAQLEPGGVVVAAPKKAASVSFQQARGKVSTPGDRAGEAARTVLQVSSGEPAMNALVSPITLVVAPFAAAYGAVSGSQQKLPPSKLLEAEEALRQELARMAEQKHLRDWFLKCAKRRTRGPIVAAEAVQTLAAREAVSTVVETRVEDLRLNRKGKGEDTYVLDMKARVRVLRASDGAVLYDQPYEYESRQALFLDWTRKGGLEGVAQTGYRFLAEQMVAAALRRAPQKPVLLGEGHRPNPANQAAGDDAEGLQLVEWIPQQRSGEAVPGASVQVVPVAWSGEAGALEIYATGSAPGLVLRMPQTKREAGNQAIEDTEWFLDGMQDSPNLVVQLTACAAAIPVSLWGQAVALIRGVPEKKLASAKAALTRAVKERRPHNELAQAVVRELAPRTAQPVLAMNQPYPGRGGIGRESLARLASGNSGGARQPQVLKASFPQENPSTAVEVHVRHAGLTGGDGVNPSFAFEARARVRVFRTSDGREIYSFPVYYRSQGRHYTEWAANDARLFREELERCYRQMSRSISEQLVTRHLVAPRGEPASMLVGK